MKKTVEISNARELYEYALKLLGYRNYSEEGLRKKLQVKSNDQEAITQTIKKLVSFNLLNETSFADSVYNEWLRKKSYGKKHLKITLKKYSIEDNRIDEIMNTFSIETEKVFAQEAGKKFIKRKGRNFDINDIKTKGAMYRFLLSRGFSYEIAQHCIRSFF